jgi:hypothetical protein
MAPDGKKVIYRVIGNQGGHYLLQIDSGEVRKVAGLDQFQLPSDWAADGRRVLGECAAPGFGICELDTVSGSVKPIMVHPTDQLLYPSWSWDERAMVFMRRAPGEPSSIWVSPVGAGGRVGPEADWVRISLPDSDDARPRFSADGGTIFYELGRGGQLWLAAQKVERGSYRPSGEPILLSRTPQQNTVLSEAGPYPLLVVTAKRVYFSAKTIRGNLWSTSLY